MSNLDQADNLLPNGPKSEAKAASGWSVGGGGGRKNPDGHCPLHPRSGKGWLTFRKAPHCDQWPRPQPQTLAVRNSLLADGTELLYLFPHRLLCMSAKNLPVISKLRQKVPPVLSAVNKRLPRHKNDLKRTKACSVGFLPCKDIERSTCSTSGDRCSEGAVLPTVRENYY